MVDAHAGERPRRLRISTEDQQLFQRIDDPGGEVRFYPHDPERNAPPYLRLNIIGDGTADSAFVRCSELIRFYFGPASKVCQFLFDFDENGENPSFTTQNGQAGSPRGGL